MGALFISVVMLFPNGLAGIFDKLKTLYKSKFSVERAKEKIPILKDKKEADDVDINSSATAD